MPRFNHKGVAPIFILYAIVAVLVIGGLVYKSNKEKNHKLVSSPEVSGKLEVYTSPLGFSFQNSNLEKITEFSVDVDKLASLSDKDLVYPPKTSTTSSSDGTVIDADAYYLSVTKISAVGTLSSEITKKMGHMGMDFFQFLEEDKTLYNEVRDLIAKKIEPKGSIYFRDSGQFQKFELQEYTNFKSGLSGFKNYVIGGFAVPGLDLHREYYLFASNKKYIIHIASRLSCDKKDQLEERHRKYEDSSKTSYTIDSSFNTEEYVRELHFIAPECESTSKNKADLDLLLDSLRFN
jgi:hypothetical protein